MKHPNRLLTGVGKRHAQLTAGDFSLQSGTFADDAKHPYDFTFQIVYVLVRAKLSQYAACSQYKKKRLDSMRKAIKIQIIQDTIHVQDSSPEYYPASQGHSVAELAAQYVIQDLPASSSHDREMVLAEDLMTALCNASS